MVWVLFNQKQLLKDVEIMNKAIYFYRNPSKNSISGSNSRKKESGYGRQPTNVVEVTNSECLTWTHSKTFFFLTVLPKLFFLHNLKLVKGNLIHNLEQVQSVLCIAWSWFSACGLLLCKRSVRYHSCYVAVFLLPLGFDLSPRDPAATYKFYFLLFCFGVQVFWFSL